MERHGAPLAMRRFSVQASGSDAAFSAELDGDFLVGTLEGPLNLEGWTGPINPPWPREALRWNRPHRNGPTGRWI